MKKIALLIYGLLFAAIIGLLVYDYYPDKMIEQDALIRAAVIAIGIILGMMRSGNHQTQKHSTRKAMFTKAYPKYIQNVFSDDQNAEKLFFEAVEDFNRDRPAAGVEKLNKLRGECRNSADRYAVTVFTALCLDDMQVYDQAAEQYRAALEIKRESTMASNLGLVLDRLGKLEEAEKAYALAIRLEPENPNPLNNLAQRCIRMGEYEKGREYALKAIEINPKMHQALSAMAICSYMLGDEESYTRYYRQAVSNGSNGEKIKAFLQSLNPEF